MYDQWFNVVYYFLDYIIKFFDITNLRPIILISIFYKLYTKWLYYILWVNMGLNRIIYSKKAGNFSGIKGSKEKLHILKQLYTQIQV